VAARPLAEQSGRQRSRQVSRKTSGALEAPGKLFLPTPLLPSPYPRSARASLPFTPKRSLALPAGYDSSGEGLQLAFSLSPYSSDYRPAYWVRLNDLLADAGAIHGPQLSWEEFQALPGTRLDQGERRELLLERLLGSN
jgi:hypothetical protein